MLFFVIFPVLSLFLFSTNLYILLPSRRDKLEFFGQISINERQILIKHKFRLFLCML